MACPVTQLPRAAFQSLRMAVAQDAWEMKGPWTQMFWAEAVTNSTLKKMRKRSLPGAIRMLIYSGWQPCQGFHIDGRGGPPPRYPCPVLLSREEQKLTTLGSASCFCLPALFRELKIPSICMANTMLSLRDTGQARSWCLGSTWRKSEHGLGSGKALIHRPPWRPAVALSPPSSCPSLESCCR